MTFTGDGNAGEDFNHLHVGAGGTHVHHDWGGDVALRKVRHPALPRGYEAPNLRRHDRPRDDLVPLPHMDDSAHAAVGPHAEPTLVRARGPLLFL